MQFVIVHYNIAWFLDKVGNNIYVYVMTFFKDVFDYFVWHNSESIGFVSLVIGPPNSKSLSLPNVYS